MLNPAISLACDDADEYENSVDGINLFIDFAPDRSQDAERHYRAIVEEGHSVTMACNADGNYITVYNYYS